MKTATYLLDRRFSVAFTFNGHTLDVEWLPHVPHFKIGRKLLPKYREVRNQFLAELVPFFGNIMVVDL